MVLLEANAHEHGLAEVACHLQTLRTDTRGVAVLIASRILQGGTAWQRGDRKQLPDARVWCGDRRVFIQGETNDTLSLCSDDPR